MRNRDREEIIKAFCYLYCPEEEYAMLKSMPLERSDPDGSLFDEYFSTIQTVMNAAQDNSLTYEEKELLEAKMKLSSLKFGYPERVFINIGGYNDRVSE